MLTDDILVKLLRASDKEALRIIYQRYWRIVCLNALRKNISPLMAEELTQSLFVNIWEKRATSEIDNLSAYFLSAIK